MSLALSASNSTTAGLHHHPSTSESRETEQRQHRLGGTPEATDLPTQNASLSPISSSSTAGLVNTNRIASILVFSSSCRAYCLPFYLLSSDFLFTFKYRTPPLLVIASPRGTSPSCSSLLPPRAPPTTFPFQWFCRPTAASSAFQLCTTTEYTHTHRPSKRRSCPPARSHPITSPPAPFRLPTCQGFPPENTNLDPFGHIHHPPSPSSRDLELELELEPILLIGSIESSLDRHFPSRPCRRRQIFRPHESELKGRHQPAFFQPSTQPPVVKQSITHTLFTTDTFDPRVQFRLRFCPKASNPWTSTCCILHHSVCGPQSISSTQSSRPQLPDLDVPCLRLSIRRKTTCTASHPTATGRTPDTLHGRELCENGIKYPLPPSPRNFDPSAHVPHTLHRIALRSGKRIQLRKSALPKPRSLYNFELKHGSLCGQP